MLTEAQIAQYNDDGYVLMTGLLESDTVAARADLTA